MTVLNMGILVMPDFACAAAFPSVTQGDTNTNRVTGTLIHDRFLHRASTVLKHLYKSLKDRLDDSACDSCLRANADSLGSKHHGPAVSASGNLVS